jgi:UDP-N-acetylmuramyl tripeptide synthase
VRLGQAGVTFDFTCDEADSWQMSLGDGGVYIVYNLLAAAAVALRAGVDSATFLQTLDGFDPGNGRLQHFVIGDHPVVLNLAKNPTGLNQNISLMLADERLKALYIIINDEANDGRDVSWLWDVDFERLTERQDVSFVMAGGHRANDLQVRLKYAGIAAPVVLRMDDVLDCAFVLPKQNPLYVITNYSALWPTKTKLEQRSQKDE